MRTFNHQKTDGRTSKQENNRQGTRGRGESMQRGTWRRGTHTFKQTTDENKRETPPAHPQQKNRLNTCGNTAEEKRGANKSATPLTGPTTTREGQRQKQKRATRKRSKPRREGNKKSLTDPRAHCKPPKADPGVGMQGAGGSWESKEERPRENHPERKSIKKKHRTKRRVGSSHSRPWALWKLSEEGFSLQCSLGKLYTDSKGPTYSHQRMTNLPIIAITARRSPEDSQSKGIQIPIALSGRTCLWSPFKGMVHVLVEVALLPTSLSSPPGEQSPLARAFWTVMLYSPAADHLEMRTL